MTKQLESTQIEDKTAAQRLAKDLRKQRPFNTGTVIAWESVTGAGIAYQYAAIFASGSWYTTIQHDNAHVQRKMTHEELLAFFGERGDHLRNIRVATAFEAVQA